MPVDVQGLTSAEVADRVARGQVNTLPSRSGRSTLDIVRANVLTRVNAILFVLFMCVAVTGHFIQGIFGLLIVVNSTIGIIQELRAKRTLDNLAVVGEAHPTVIRDGVARQIVRDEVVLDDLIVVTPGEQVVVDGVVVDADYLEVDESLLTGESDPEPKPSGSEVLSGSFVVSGSGTYRATKVGSASYAAQLTAEAARFTLVKSELTQGINQILKVITWVLVPVGLATVWVQLFQAGHDWRRAMLAMAGALVSMLMVGMLMDLPQSKHDVKEVMAVIAWRIPFSVAFALIAWFLLPFSASIRAVMVICALAPIAIFSTLFTDKVLGNAKLAGFSLAITAMISLVMMAVAHALMGV